MEEISQDRTKKAIPQLIYNLISAAAEDLIYWSPKLDIEKRITGGAEYSLLANLKTGRMAATMKNGKIDIINLNSRRAEFQLEGHTRRIVSLCNIDTNKQDEELIATASEDRSIRIWDINRKSSRVFAQDVGLISSLIYHPQTRYLITSGENIVTLWDYEATKIGHRIKLGELSIITQLLQINSQEIATLCRSPKYQVQIWDVASKKLAQKRDIPGVYGFECGVLVKDRKALLLGEIGKGRVFVLNLFTYQITNIYNIHSDTINQILVLNSTEAISCSYDAKIKLFEILTGNIKFVLDEHINKPLSSKIAMLLPSFYLQYRNISSYAGDYRVIIGEYALNIDPHLLGEIAPNIYQNEKKATQIEYMNSEISFKQIFMPFMDNQLEINKINLPEAIILGQYFPNIRAKYSLYIKEQAASNLELLFKDNKTNGELWNVIFDDQPLTQDLNISVKINQGEIFQIRTIEFIVRTSLCLWENMQEEITNDQKYYSIQIQELFELEKQIDTNESVKVGYKSIEKYLKGEKLSINSCNYPFLLCFSYYYKLERLKDICETSKNGIFRGSACVINHMDPLSTINCDKCKEEVCIDCHLFLFYRKSEVNHAAAIHKILNNLKKTQPKSDELSSHEICVSTKTKNNLAGFYLYTDVLKTMNPNLIIDPECIAIIPKRNYLLKIMKIYNIEFSGEFVLKQMLPIKDQRIVKKVIENATNEFKLMETMTGSFRNSILSYHHGSNESASEILMENWGKPFNRINFRELKERDFFQIIRECVNALDEIHSSNMYHGDIKMENIILNEKCYVPKFIDYGISSKLLLESDIIAPRIARRKKNNMEYYKGLTYHMAPTELLQYENPTEDENREITYSLSQSDVFCLGFTIFCMITKCSYKVLKELQILRSSISTENKFYTETKRILVESLSHSNWNKEFTSKLEQIIMVCLGPVFSRPDTLHLYPMFQLFDTLPVDQFIDLCDSFYESTEIVDLIGFAKINQEIVNIREEEIKYEEGLKLCAKAVKKLKKIFGENYLKTREYLLICEHYGKLLKQKCQFEESEKYYERAIQLADKLLTPLHPLLTLLYDHLEALLNTKGKYNEAEVMGTKSVDIARQIHGDKAHPDIASSYNNLASTYTNQDKYELAKEMYTLALNQELELYGLYTERIAITYANIGTLSHKLGNHKVAEENLKKALNILELIYVENYPNVATFYSNLAAVYDSQGDLKGEEMHTKALELRLRLYGDTPHVHVAHSYNNLGTFFSEQKGDYERALECATKATDIILLIHQKNTSHPKVILYFHNLSAIRNKHKSYLSNPGVHLYESFIKSLTAFGYLSNQTQYKLSQFNEYYSKINNEEKSELFRKIKGLQEADSMGGDIGSTLAISVNANN